MECLNALFYYFGRLHSDRLIIANLFLRVAYCLWLLLATERLTCDASLYSDLLGYLYFMFIVYHKLRICREQDKKLFDTSQILYIYVIIDLVLIELVLW